MRFRRFVTWAGVTGAALGALLTGAGPATAGGPTSVMLVAPESGKAAAIYTTSPDYQTLDASIGREPAASAPPSLTDVEAGGQRQVTVTWLVHDVSVWRVDFVYPDAAGGPWIHTREVGEKGLPEQGVWHHAAQPKALGALLGRMGLLGPDKGLGVSAPDYPFGVAQGSSPAASSPAPAAAEDTAGGTDWWLSLPGLGAGLALGSAGTLLASRLMSRRTPRDPGPRQELVDA
ncbi:hypothetical protein [Streptomyces sp. MI02-7b]|uniref:hypothetical protein n=1 Tax=Streptomyces sp. MI02-7b TaxID=462941 RepID=UPI0029A60F08|nr:hypothetical protein [Streptomyces sp. MI02-7b]MDX3071915.1 hypothetical protein [Streptomyces sp. MI02-7b]